MLAERQRLSTNPLTMSEGVNLQVQDVYVPLGLVERKKISKRQNDISPERGSEIYQELEITQKFQNDEFLTQVFQQKNTPTSKGKRIAIIGEPGAGKTTLLQQIADYLSKENNQSIVTWVSLADLQGRDLEKYFLEIWLNSAIQKIGEAEVTKQIKQDFITQFKHSQVWLLLDGLDEMSVNAGNALTDIARQIRESGCINQARIVLTCRLNLWDGSSNALDNFDIYRTLDFSYPEQVEKFIDKWFTAIAEPDRERGQRLCNALKESGKERIQDLVKNPLRLTLLCVNWQAREGNLPDTQAGFYQQLVDDFYKWKQDQFTTKAAQRQELNIKLGELAKKAIDKEVTRFRLRGEFVNQFLGEDEEGSLLRLALRLGWINQVGLDIERKPVYAFFHASFQEYFAATVINDWHFFLNHVPKNPSLGTYRIFEAHWKQTILLWVGRSNIDKKNKEEFINALLEFNSRRKFKTRRNISIDFYDIQSTFLAATLVAEFRDYSDIDGIVKFLVILACGFTEELQWLASIDSMEDEAYKVLPQTDRKTAIEVLLPILHSSQVEEDKHRMAAFFLWKIGTGNQTVIDAFVQFIQSNPMDYSRHWPIAYYLGKIDPGNLLAIDTLVEILQSNQVDYSTYSYREAIKSLGEIDPGNQTAINILVDILQSNQVNDFTRRLVAESLGEIDPGNQAAIDTLVKIIQSNQVDNSIREEAATGLETIGIRNQAAINALLQILDCTQLDNYTCSQVAFSLAKIATGNQTAIDTLLQILQSNQVDNFRLEMANCLGQINSGNQTAIDTLIQILQSNQIDPSIYRKAAYYLGKIDPGNQTAINTLVKSMCSTHVDDDLLSCIYYLGEIGTGNETVINALVKVLMSALANFSASYDIFMSDKNKTDCDDVIRHSQTLAIAVLSLGRVAIGHQTTIDALVKILCFPNMFNFICKEAAKSLNQILQKHHLAKVVTELKYCLINDELFKTCYSVLWYCAQNMSYSEFYQAWHQSTSNTNIISKLAKIAWIPFSLLIWLFL